MEALFNAIASFKRSAMAYGCTECEINFYIRSITADKGLLELNHSETQDLLHSLRGCLEMAKSDQCFIVNHIKAVVNEVVAY